MHIAKNAMCIFQTKLKTSQIKHKSHLFIACLSLFSSATGVVSLLTLMGTLGKKLATKLWFSPTVVVMGVFSKSILTERTRKKRGRLCSLYALSEVFSNSTHSLVDDCLLACVTNSSNQLVVTQKNIFFSREHNLNMALSASQRTTVWRLNSTKWSALHKKFAWPSMWLSGVLAVNLSAACTTVLKCNSSSH